MVSQAHRLFRFSRATVAVEELGPVFLDPGAQVRALLVPEAQA
jgi:hypothetical protein